MGTPNSWEVSVTPCPWRRAAITAAFTSALCRLCPTAYLHRYHHRPKRPSWHKGGEASCCDGEGASTDGGAVGGFSVSAPCNRPMSSKIAVCIASMKSPMLGWQGGMALGDGPVGTYGSSASIVNRNECPSIGGSNTTPAGGIVCGVTLLVIVSVNAAVWPPGSFPVVNAMVYTPSMKRPSNAKASVVDGELRGLRLLNRAVRLDVERARTARRRLTRATRPQRARHV